MIINFIGNDGSGKSTLINKIKKEYIHENKKIIVLNEFETPILKVLKKIIPKKVKNNEKVKKFSPGYLYLIIQFLDNFLQIMFYKVFYSKTIILKDRYTTDFIATMIEVGKYNIVFKILYSFLPSADLNLKIQVFPETSWKRRGKIKNLNFYILKEEIYSNILGNKKNIIFINNENNIEKSVSNILKKIYLKQKLEKIKVLKISGIDGAGKSTTIENIEEILKSLNISYTQIHFYYNYIPIKLIKILRKIQGKKEKSTQEYNEASIENEKKSKNKNKNLFWKIYVLTDAIIQFSYLKLIGFNKLKIYDRYFLDYKISWDFLGVTYNKGIFDFFGKYSKNYFILGADAETLYKRKPEHTEEFFQETVTAYKKLQIEYKLDFINTAEKSPEQVTEYILNKVQ